MYSPYRKQNVFLVGIHVILPCLHYSTIEYDTIEGNIELVLDSSSGMAVLELLTVESTMMR